MTVLLLDTNVVSILFNRNHALRQTCIWMPWGSSWRAALDEHMALYLTLYPDERTCGIWAAVVDRCRRAGRPIRNADAWIAASARQWGCPPVTADFN